MAKTTTLATDNALLEDSASQHELNAFASKHPQPQSSGESTTQFTKEIVLVDFDGEADPLNPQNWSMTKKVYTTALWALTTSWITFASAIYSAGLEQICEEFHVSYTTANAGTALLIFGFALGPMLWSPLCELYGRKWPALAVSDDSFCFSRTWIAEFRI